MDNYGFVKVAAAVPQVAVADCARNAERIVALAPEELREAYPDLRIIFITPPYTWYTVPEVTCEEYDLGGGVLEDYVNAEIGICEALDVEVIDIYHNYYPHETWDDLYLYTDDGLHPNEAGREKIAQTIAEYLDNYSEDVGVKSPRL